VTPPAIDILTLDNAIVGGLPVHKGAMRPIGAVEAQEMYGVLTPGVECSRNPMANTLIAVRLGA